MEYVAERPEKRDFAAYVDDIFQGGRSLDSKLGAMLVGLSLALGLLADLLFSGAEVGVNVPLWTGAMAITYFASMRLGGRELGPRQTAMLVTSVAVSVMVVWRASGTLQIIDIAASTVLFMLAVALPVREGSPRASLLSFVCALIVAMIAACFGGVRLLGSMSRGYKLDDESKAIALSVGRGLLVAAPLLAVFGGLFIAADAVFEVQVQRVSSFDISSLRSHFLWVAGVAWLVCGVFWSGLGIEMPKPLEWEIPEPRRLKAIEIVIILGSLAALSTAFVAIQVRYLFGGEDLVQRSIHLTYAEYAHRGFFELVAAAGLALPLLLALGWARSRSFYAARFFRVLATVLVGLLLVVMLSALERMRIYEQAFGLTELRLYVVAFLLWLGVVLIWFVVVTWRERREDFAAGALVAGMIAVLALNALSPDAAIATRNLDRAAAGKTFDAGHAASLSADAVPDLVGRIEQLPDAQACVIAGELLAGWSSEGEGVRDWNWSRHQARQTVQEHRDELAAACR